MKALYICDDKDNWEYIRNLFASHFRRVELICVIGGDDAFEYLSYEGPFGVILIDATMKNEEPGPLAEKLIEVAGERPIVFMGSQAMINDRVDDRLYNGHYLNQILLTPIDIATFTNAINKCINWAKEEEFEKSIEEIDPEELLPMKLRNFYLFNTLPYDVFLELTSTKFVKVISANKQYTQSEINSYAKKNVKVLYLRKNEYLKFLEEGIDKIITVFNSPKKPPARKIMANQVKAILLIHQYVRTVGVSENIIKLCNQVISVTRGVFLEHKKFKDIVASFPGGQFDIAEQAILTIYLCEAILVGLGWASDMSRAKLGLASILYDSMLSNDDLAKVRNLEDPYLQMFTESEQEEYKEHPLKAAELSGYFQGFSDVDFIIAQHHERPRGDGFPNKLSTNKLTAHSCAFILANNFVTRFASEDKKQGVLLNIFREMKSIYNQGNFKEPLNALQRTIV